MNTENENRNPFIDRLMSTEELSDVSAAGMHAEVIEGICPMCGEVIYIHLYETSLIQRINTRCTAKDCTYSYDYYFFKE